MLTVYKKLGCGTEAARRCVTLKMLPSYSRSREMTPLRMACVSSY